MSEAKIAKVVVVGLGYIGLPTAAMIASRDVDVVGVDINQDIVNTINSGKIHIAEPDLDTIVHSVVNVGKLTAKLVPEAADVFIITVPTPFKDDHKPDLSYIHAAATSIAPFLNKGNLVILESTSPVATTEQLSKWLNIDRPELAFPHNSKQPDIAIAYCPERVLPGKILHEIVYNDRVIGGITPQCAKRAEQLYALFLQGKCISTNARTAEMCKLTENAFRDVNIAFANELSMICNDLEIDVWELIGLANRHPRVNILQPGCGVGGHCIAVDPWFIVDKTPDKAKLIKAARQVNDYKPEFVVEKVKQAAKKFTNPTIACLGLTFKADVDDLRGSPAFEIVKRLAQRKIGKLLVVEPNIKSCPDCLVSYEHVEHVFLEDAISRADIVLFLVGHKSFIEIDSNLLVDNNKLIIDAVGIS